MACFDHELREIVLRIVYDGAATAGKTANLRSLHESFSARARGDFHVPEETATGRTLYFDWLELHAGYVEDWPLRCQLLTVPGQLTLAERRFRLLRGIDAAVLVCDSSPAGVRAGRVAWVFLEKVLAATGNAETPILVQANKQDLPGALSPAEIEERLGVGRRVLPASALSGDGVRETFLAALAAARERLRATLRDRGPEELPPHVESAEQVYTAMLAEEEAPPDPDIAEALEAALAAVERG